MTDLLERREAPASLLGGALRDQATVATGQIASGVGNMAFSLAVAHLLAPGAFAQFASFLALYLLLSMPGSAISAAAALEPERATRIRPLLVWGGLAIGLVLAVGSPVIGSALRLPPPMIVVLGLSTPVLGTLALDRGRLYGWSRHAQLVASLAVEPAVRLLLGLALALVAGAVGGALAVAVAGYAALEIARRRRADAVPRADRSLPGLRAHTDSVLRRTTLWTGLTFFLVVVVQNQDLLIANRLLPPDAAGQFAVLSTLGGLSAFATMTVPLVLLPRSAAGATRDLAPAIVVTLFIGGGVVAVAALAPASLVGALFGGRYTAVAGLLVPYVAAMALLGVSRVLVAHRCATGAGRSRVALVLSAAALQASLIVAFGHDPRGVAYATVVAISGLTVSLGTAELVRLESVRLALARLVSTLTRPIVLAVSACTAAGLGLRLFVPRGLWIDEATSVDQARMSFSHMITNLRATDVHPPLYFSVLWVTVRWIGSGELAVRLPSIVAGALVVPMLYLLGREAYDRRTGVVAAVAGTVAPIMVWYSQEARMYALLMLWAVVALWAQVRIFKHGERRDWIVYAGASIALAWTQYFGLLQVLVQQVAFLMVLWNRRHSGPSVRVLFRRWAAATFALGIFLVPLVPFALQQFVVNQTAGKGFGGPQQVGNASSLSSHHLTVYSALANLIWAVWGYHSHTAMALLAALWPLGMLLALALLGRRHQSVTTLLLACVLVPGVVLFALGSVKQNLFDIRYLSTTVPILFVLLARLVTGIGRRTATVVLATGLVCATLVGGLVDQQYNGANPRTYDFRAALGFVEARAKPGDVVRYDPMDLREVVQYYGQNLRLEPLSATGAATHGRHAVFVLASPRLMNGSKDHATLDRALRDLRAHDHLVQRRRLANVDLWEFR